jgi:tetratricopeptide (TPR) repeat protein
MVAMSPVLHIVVPHHELFAEHYLYLPSVGPLLLAGLAAERLRARVSRRVWLWGTAIVLAALGVRTLVRIPDWKDERTLWSRTVEDAPTCARARLNLGTILAREGRHAEAREHLEAAVRYEPLSAYARLALSRLYGLLGEPRGAAEQAAAALHAARTDPLTRVSEGTVLLALGRPKEAVVALRDEVQRGKRRGTLRKALAMALEGSGELAEALRVYRWHAKFQSGDRTAIRRGYLLAVRLGDREAEEELAARLRLMGEPIPTPGAPVQSPADPLSER